jgi:hypothetical protein
MSQEIYVSVDVETDGPIPGPHSMLSLGAVALTFETAELRATVIDSFSINLELLEGAAPDPKTAEFWAKNPEAWAVARFAPREPGYAMRSFGAWLDGLPGKPVFVGYPASFDFMFVYWYLIRFAGSSPFSFSALDMKTLAWALLGGKFRDATKRRMPRDWHRGAPKHDHTAMTDAMGQAVLFANMVEHLKATRPTMHAGKCSVPPSGWRCTRAPGHDGPCAAHPIE